MIRANSRFTNLLHEAHGYPIMSFWGSYPFGFFLIMQSIYLVMAMFNQRKPEVVLIDLAILFFFCVLWGIVRWLLRKQALIVGKEGIIYTSGIYTVYTPWENISKLANSPYGAQPALQLRESPKPIALEQGIQEQRAAIENTFRPNRPIKITSRYEQYNYLPLPPHWRKSAPWQDIKRHVPELEIAVMNV